jgi:hypothetical protein
MYIFLLFHIKLISGTDDRMKVENNFNLENMNSDLTLLSISYRSFLSIYNTKSQEIKINIISMKTTTKKYS